MLLCRHTPSIERSVINMNLRFGDTRHNRYFLVSRSNCKKPSVWRQRHRLYAIWMSERVLKSANSVRCAVRDECLCCGREMHKGNTGHSETVDPVYASICLNLLPETTRSLLLKPEETGVDYLHDHRCCPKPEWISERWLAF